MNIALAALALGRGKLFPPAATSGVEQRDEGPLDQVVVTGVGHWRGEGLALVEAVRLKEAQAWQHRATSMAGRSSPSPAWASSPRSAPARPTTGRSSTAGQSGIRRITRFPTEGLKTTIAGTRRFRARRAVLLARARRAPGRPWRPRKRSAKSGIGAKAISRARCSSPSRRSRSNGRSAKRLAAASGANDAVGYDDLLRASATGRFHAIHERCLFGSVAEHLADHFGTKGSPISLSTACASGATAIQLGVEAIRRGETDAALCIGTDGSVNPESLDPLLAAVRALDRQRSAAKARQSRSPRTATAS